MITVVAEKPSVAKELAISLGLKDRQNGYWKGAKYQVTWAYGHLVTLCDPHAYNPDYKKWKLEDLPIIPDPFKITPIDQKSSNQQLKIVKDLLNNSTQIICATDAGREGELIFRFILEYSNIKKSIPIQRLWINSLTSEAIKEGLERLRPIKEFNLLYEAARCRAQADWLVGINATRYFTIHFGLSGQVLGLGRVQTPVLNLIYQRDYEINHFITQDYWTISTKFKDIRFESKQGKFFDENKANLLIQKVTDQIAQITKVKEGKEKVMPPRPYDLTTLQRDMNRREHLTAQQTLKIAQSLYEKKLISYPRTDSSYLSNDLIKKMPLLLNKLAKFKPNELSNLDFNEFLKNRKNRVFNEHKVTDHHAIIPTGQYPKGLDQSHQKVYNAIVTRLIAAFYPPCEKASMLVELTTNGEVFKSMGHTILKKGWYELFPFMAQSDKLLPHFKKGENGPHTPSKEQKKTRPPLHYTENELLKVMETAGRLVEDETLRQSLKERGLGTPATRASIIETLISRQFIKRDKKILTITPQGMQLVCLIPSKNMKSAEMTGIWEEKLKAIERGEYPSNKFMDEIKQFVHELLPTGSPIAFPATGKLLGKCPKCKTEVYQYAHHYLCGKSVQSIQECKQNPKLGPAQPCLAWKNEMLGRAFTPQMAREVLHTHLTLKSYSFNLNGQIQWGKFFMDANSQLSVEPIFGNLSSGTNSQTYSKNKEIQKSTLLPACPLCKGQVTDNSKFIRCSNWKNGCSLIIWKKVAQKTISMTQIKKILQKRQSDFIKGLKSKAGKEFSAKLVLNNEGKITFQFPPTQ